MRMIRQWTLGRMIFGVVGAIDRSLNTTDQVTALGIKPGGESRILLAVHRTRLPWTPDSEG